MESILKKMGDGMTRGRHRRQTSEITVTAHSRDASGKTFQYCLPDMAMLAEFVRTINTPLMSDSDDSFEPPLLDVPHRLTHTPSEAHRSVTAAAFLQCQPVKPIQPPLNTRKAIDRRASTENLALLLGLLRILVA